MKKLCLIVPVLLAASCSERQSAAEQQYAEAADCYAVLNSAKTGLLGSAVSQGKPPPPSEEMDEAIQSFRERAIGLGSALNKTPPEVREELFSLVLAEMAKFKDLEAPEIRKLMENQADRMTKCADKF